MHYNVSKPAVVRLCSIVSSSYSRENLECEPFGFNFYYARIRRVIAFKSAQVLINISITAAGLRYGEHSLTRNANNGAPRRRSLSPVSRYMSKKFDVPNIALLDGYSALSNVNIYRRRSVITYIVTPYVKHRANHSCPRRP